MTQSDPNVLALTLADGREEKIKRGRASNVQLRNLAALRRRQRFLADRIAHSRKTTGLVSYDEAEEQAVRWACEILETLLAVPVSTS